MIKVKTPDGKALEAESLRALAEVLWHEMLVPEPTLEEWMAGSAKRAKNWNGSVIRTASAEEHVRDLIEAGILTPV